MKIGIVGGTGVMGKFFQKIFIRYGCDVTIWGRKSEISLEDFVQNVDTVLVSVPIDSTEKIIQELGKFLREDQCITDLTSLKKFPMEAMKKYTKAQYFGMHPMFAPPISGTMQSQNLLFCEGEGSRFGKKTQKFFEEIFTQDGAVCLHSSAEEHDTLMTIVQGLSHFLDIAFIKTLSQTSIPVEKIFASRSPAYALKMMLAGRTISQDANLYGNIQIQNPENITTLEKFFEVSQELFEVIKAKDLEKFEEIFDAEKKYLGKYGKKSQEESDKVIDFLANEVLIRKQNKRREEYTQKSKSNDNLREKKIGILGPKNTFSCIAGEKYFGSLEEITLYPSIPSLFSAYKKGEISEIFVPIENMLHGSVAETIDGISASNLYIQEIFEMKISPSLFIPENLEEKDIVQIFSHPQALAQCSDFLEQKFPDVEFIPMPSTAGGVERILEVPFSAAIAAPETAEKYPVQELYSEIANTNKNATRFARLSSHKNTNNRKNNKTDNISENLKKEKKERVYEGGVIFTFAKDAPGTLASVLELFSSHSINLTKIESRPTGGGFGEYSFFVTYSGQIPHQEKEVIFQKIQEKVSTFRSIGEFEVLQDLV